MNISPSPRPSLWDRWVAPVLDKYCLVFCVCLVAIACARIVSTYKQLSLTTDETFHFGCAIDYLAKHRITWDLENPPIARALESLGPYLVLHARPIEQSDPRREGVAIIAVSGNYGRTVSWLRLGTLPFFLLACGVVGYWAARSFGKPVGVLAVALFTFLPTVLADAGLTTTDMAVGATVSSAFLALLLWAEKPRWYMALLLGVCTALALTSKYTALGYVPLSAVLAFACYWAVHRPTGRELWQLAKKRLGTFLLAAATAMVLVWAAFGFSAGDVRILRHEVVTVPAPEFFAGLKWAENHVRTGHSAFLLGQTSRSGWWYYYPIALLVKMPIAFLIMAAIGAYLCMKKRSLPYLLPLSFSVAILLPAMSGPIDIGIRHIAPIYVSLSIVAALGLVEVMRSIPSYSLAAVTAAALVGWMAISVAASHPDYLAYFNAFAGKHPENVLVDSNYDWGQELILLSRHLHQLHADKVSLDCIDGVRQPAYLQVWYELPPIQLVDARSPAPGWSVICPTIDKAYRPDVLQTTGGAEPWYDRVAPTEYLGPLALYYTQPPSNSSAASEDNSSSLQ